MKKVIATALAVTMLMANSISASAVTTGVWDWGAAQKSIDSARGAGYEQRRVSY